MYFPHLHRTMFILVFIIHVQDDFDLSAVSRGWKSVGEFPFPRGEVPVFHFDQGDEVHLEVLGFGYFQVCDSKCKWQRQGKPQTK